MAKLVLGLLLVLAVAVTTTSAECEKDMVDLSRECKKFCMFPAEPKIPPSGACCEVVKRADIPCVCKKVDEKMEKVWCMEKVVYIAKACNRPFQPGYKCGSYTVPQALGL